MSRREEISKSDTKSRFDEIHKKNLEVLKKRVEIYKTGDDSDEEEVIEIDKTKIDALFVNYTGKRDEKIYTFFENGENIDCLVCIRQIKSKDHIWNCKTCFISIHLSCVQRWSNDSIIQKRISNENQPDGHYSSTGMYVPKKNISITWDCPQCRTNYDANEIPKYYECYCGKEINPQNQPFLIPHSCGEICEKSLNPQCGHYCLLLCHPGNHPTCAQMIEKSCSCLRSPVKTIRCSQQNWSCDRKCEKLLDCGVHKCEDTCHSICSPCQKSRLTPCACGSSSKEIKCEKKTWSCLKKCGKKLTCNVHFCDEKCHSGNCQSCIYGLGMTCFCGKQTKVSANCETFIKESCGQTCSKPLKCGISDHECMSRCHKGECGQCVELTVKNCRCGNLKKESPCSKELQCELKCKNMKNCKKHACNKKCCIECSPCEKVCSKPLSCGKHKCGALCHNGNCYPCMSRSLSKCKCGLTSVSVNCGRKNRTPKCKEICRIGSKCHHEALPHKCHFGECPNCVQLCSELLPCNHLCQEKCHDNVKTVTKDKTFVPKLPGEYAEEKIEMRKLPHPPCKTFVKMLCYGGHELIDMTCNAAKTLSCGRVCNRKLKCGNHQCKLMCHPVKNVNDEEEDENCEECNMPCLFERQCSHPCSKNRCHPQMSSISNCKRCHVSIKSKCFCGLTDIFFRCCDVNKKGLTKPEIDLLQEKYMSCGLKCMKTFPCGHPCVSNCHKGACPNAEDCKKKVKLTCACKLRKVEYNCEYIRTEKISSVLACDLICEERKKEQKELLELEKIKTKEKEERENQIELELFEKKFGPKHFRRKEKKVEEAKTTYDYKYKIAICSCMILFFAVMILCILNE